MPATCGKVSHCISPEPISVSLFHLWRVEHRTGFGARLFPDFIIITETALGWARFLPLWPGAAAFGFKAAGSDLFRAKPSQACPSPISFLVLNLGTWKSHCTFRTTSLSGLPPPVGTYHAGHRR